jgi:YfiH family protein
MQEHKIGSIEWLSYSVFDPHRNVTNVVTTRVGGRSTGAYASLNLALHVGDDADTVLENRATLTQALGVEPESLTMPQQVHGNRVVVVTAGDRGRGAVDEGDAVPGADGLVTRTPGLPLAVLIADCVAVSLYDPNQNAIGLAHAGWKGTLKRIAGDTASKMVEAFGCDPADIVAGISPSIGRGHYEVGEDVLKAYQKEFGRAGARELIEEDMHGTCYLDLWKANEAQLLDRGVLEKNIAISEMCTACHPSRFYSHRLEHGKTGRFVGLIMLHTGTVRQY